MKLFSSLSQNLTLQRNAPNLLFIGGVTGMIGTTVLASMATLKLEEVLNEAQETMKKAKDKVEEENAAEIKHFEESKARGDTTSKYEKKYTEEDRKQDTAKIYVQTGVKIIRMYGPAILLGSASIAMLTKSHDMLSKRNAALTAAYAALDKGFKEYRARVVEKYGEEEDRKFRYDSEKVKVKDEETGKTKEVYRVGPNAPSIYAKFFDPTSTNWSKEPEYNRLFLHSQQRYVNDLLHSRGHLFLNEVYDSLDIPRSQAGSVVGWIMAEGNSNYVDFGIFTTRASDEIRAFVNGEEGSILLDFNVDGVIFDKIDTPREAPSWQRS